MLGLHSSLAAQAALGGDRRSPRRALDDDARKRVISLFQDGLKETAIINIGRPKAKNHFFTRVLYIVKDSHGRCFIRDFSITFDDKPSAAPASRPVNSLG
jgi:hypothetical protein